MLLGTRQDPRLITNKYINRFGMKIERPNSHPIQ